MQNELKRFFKEEEGAAGLEYTLLAALVVVVLTLFILPIRNVANNIWTAVNTAFSNAGP